MELSNFVLAGLVMGQGMEAWMHATIETSCLHNSSRSALLLGRMTDRLTQEYVQRNCHRKPPSTCKMQWHAIDKNKETERTSARNSLEYEGKVAQHQVYRTLVMPRNHL